MTKLFAFLAITSWRIAVLFHDLANWFEEIRDRMYWRGREDEIDGLNELMNDIDFEKKGKP